MLLQKYAKQLFCNLVDTCNQGAKEALQEVQTIKTLHGSALSATDRDME